MITREDSNGAVVYGDGPIVDHDGYALEVSREPGSHHCLLRLSTNADGSGPKLRIDLPARSVRALIARVTEYEATEDPDFLRMLTVRNVEWLRVNQPEAFAQLTHYMQSCLQGDPR